MLPQQLPPASRSPFRLHRQKAFSLVEIALAVGIAGSALLVIFSLIPIGLSTLQDTGRQIVETEIYNKIGSELATTAAYGTPPPTSTQPKAPNMLQQYCADTKRFPAYFDAEGNELAKTGAGMPAFAVFQVRCAYGDGTTGDGITNNNPINNIWTPASDGELLSATVRIGYNVDPGGVPAANPSPTPSANIRRRTFLLSNHGN